MHRRDISYLAGYGYKETNYMQKSTLRDTGCVACARSGSAGFRASDAETGLVTFIQRHGSALHLRVPGSPIKIGGYEPPCAPPPLLGEMDEEVAAQ